MKVITVGRSQENNVVVDDPMISRIHLQIVQNDNGECSVVDLNSSNGTFVNGIKISGEFRLQPNDTIRIGSSNLPWQEYLNSTPDSYPGVPKPMGNYTGNMRAKSNKYWIWGGLCALIVIALGLGLYCGLRKSPTKQQNNPSNNDQSNIIVSEELTSNEPELPGETDQNYKY